MTIYIGHERCSRHLFGCPAGGRALDAGRAQSGTAVWTALAKPSLLVERATTRIVLSLAAKVVARVDAGASRRSRRHWLHDRKAQQSRRRKGAQKGLVWNEHGGRRAHQLRIEPLCAICKAEGRITGATIADHSLPHGGDYNCSCWPIAHPMRGLS